MASDRNKRRGARAGDDMPAGGSFNIPHVVLNHANYLRASLQARALLNDLGAQYNGYNNGYLCASWRLMKDRGWNSSHTLRKATLELEHYGLIVRTQQGDFTNKANLHAFTWRKIDEIAGKPLLLEKTLRAPDTWREDRPEFEMPEPMPRKGAARLKEAA